MPILTIHTDTHQYTPIQILVEEPWFNEPCRYNLLNNPKFKEESKKDTLSLIMGINSDANFRTNVGSFKIRV